MPEEIILANQLSRKDLVDFFNSGHLSFQHLDWISPYDRFEQHGCLAIINEGEIQALLSVEPEILPYAWIRFFVSVRDGKHNHYFVKLLQASYPYLQKKGVKEIYALSLYPWVANLLETNSFALETNIVTLLCELPDITPIVDLPEGLIIRPMTEKDLPDVEIVDCIAFPPEWQINTASLVKAYQNATYRTVACIDKLLVGYQLTTATFTLAHLARLAVTNELQRHHIGKALVQDVFSAMLGSGISEITVNTQESNKASLRLYHSLGFYQEGKIVPVYHQILDNSKNKQK